MVIGIFGAAGTVGGQLIDEFSLPGSDSQKAVDLLESRFPARSGDSAQIVFAVDSGRVDRGEARAAVKGAVAEAEAVPGVVVASDPSAPASAAQNSGQAPAGAEPTAAVAHLGRQQRQWAGQRRVWRGLASRSARRLACSQARRR